ncbi:MAG: hypothetical protein K0U52_07165, partial [Gammaproteobacteria bacterium]|nr:hypothetical protein [Gammaproteobacteria bacterium]
DPQVPIPITQDTTDKCVVLEPDPKGGYRPSPAVQLRQCSTNEDCFSCEDSEQIACVQADETIKAQQSALGNLGDTYCLPKQHQCLSGQTQDLQPCTQDIDCISCNDDLPNQEVMTCQQVPQGGMQMAAPPTDPKGVVQIPQGQYCLPQVRTCDYKNGHAEWTANEGWKCVCTHPNVMGGEDCSQLIACQNDLTTEDSKDKQLLLLNQSGPVTPWTPDLGVDPEACHIGNQQVPCSTEGAVPNTICQCQGRQVGTGRTFRNIHDQPLACEVDPCNVGPLGGTSNVELEPKTWSSTQPPNTCVCSGVDSFIWKYNQENGQYEYKGFCEDYPIPVKESQVTIPKNQEWSTSDFCNASKNPSNDSAQESLMVPGKSPQGHDVCSPDPCTGHYGDPNFTSPVSGLGHYSASAGKCVCASDEAGTVPVSECDHTVNPVCSTCVNACAQMDNPDASVRPCQPHPDPERACPVASCKTTTDGKVECVCGEDCVVTEGHFCTRKFDYQAECTGYVAVPGICQNFVDTDGTEKPASCVVPLATYTLFPDCKQSTGAAPPQCLTLGEPDNGQCEFSASHCNKHSNCIGTKLKPQDATMGSNHSAAVRLHTVAHPTVDHSFDSESKQSCLPPATTVLKECTQQTDCDSCTDSLACINVAGIGDSIVAGRTLTNPVQVSYPVTSPLECSGHGTKTDGHCVCDGHRTSTGECTDLVCYRGDNCQTAFFSVGEAGQYCLPSYMNKCDATTSDTVLTKDGWTCECKEKYAGILTQDVEGGNCSTQLACGGNQVQVDDQGKPIEYQVYAGLSKGEPQFKKQVVIPNRLTTYDTANQVSCVVPTERVKVDGVVPFFKYEVSSSADPTCQPILQNNKCIVNSADRGMTQVIRGSNQPGDPLQERVSPRFFAPVPPGLQKCPDGFSGNGTVSHPCTLGDKQVSFYDEHGDWNGQVTNLAELKAAKIPWLDKTWGSNAVPWFGVNYPGDKPWELVTEVRCIENPTYATQEDYNDKTQEYTFTQECVGSSCQGGQGTSMPEWDGARDGPIINDTERPYWITGGEYGGQCTCDGTLPGSFGNLVPAIDILDKDSRENWWRCIPNSCASEEYPTATYNADTGQCECSSSSDQYPFKTGMAYHAVDEPPRCISDSCNPGGYHIKPGLKCSSDDACKGVCVDKQCYMKWHQDRTCTTDDECYQAIVGGGQEGQARCIIPQGKTKGTCATLDYERAKAGHTCSNDVECDYGVCENGTCGGACACSHGFAQKEDDGASPLGYYCEDRCNPNPCLQGGTCSLDENGMAKCACKECASGEYCQNQDGMPIGEYCTTNDTCCSGCCSGATPPSIVGQCVAASSGNCRS